MDTHGILVTTSVFLFVLSATCSMIAMVIYLRRPGAMLVGFGFARYYYGEMRRTRPLLFIGSLVGAVAGIALLILAGPMR